MEIGLLISRVIKPSLIITTLYHISSNLFTTFLINCLGFSGRIIR